MKEKHIIGRTDKADFPELGLVDLDVKIDTGAYGSSIHCDQIVEVEIQGKKHIKFQILDESHPDYNHKEFVTPNYTTKTVKSSNGLPQERFVVETEIVLFGTKYPIKMSLSNRAEMKYPVLLGRTLLSKNFIVDTSRTNLSYKHKSKSV